MSELEALARAATPGPWETRGASVHSVATGYIMEGKSTGYIGSLSSPRGPEQRDADCAFIAAANPTAILALLSELDTLSAKNKALAERVAGLEEGLDKDTRYYLGSILRNLREFRAALPDTYGLSLGAEALSDNIDWLDCFLDASDRARTLITGADHAKG